LKKYLPLFVAGAVVLATSAQAARVAVNPITHPNMTVYQAYPGNSGGTNLSFRGYNGLGTDVIAAVPGVLSIESGGNWANYIGAAYAGIPYIGDAPTAAQAYSIKNIVLRKTTPPYVQCSDVFPVKNIPQQGSQNIRTWWPLMYEVPGTQWTLTILYGTKLPYDDDGAGGNPAGYVHTEVWTWTVDATLASLRDLLVLFHELPFGLDEVPLISDERLYWGYDVYDSYGAKIDHIKGLLDLVDSAAASLAALDYVSAGLTLGDLELAVMDACIGASPAFPNPTGPGTGIANTSENPACCKILVDIEYIGKTTGVFQPNK
jgi:hypothetical protein